MVKSSVKGVKKPRAKKPKSIAAIKNDVRSRIRQQFTWYSPEFSKCKNDAKISYGLYQCSSCQTITKKIEIDHYPAVIRTDEKTKDISLDEYFDRVFCDIDGLRALCTNCHSQVTDEQRIERMEHRKK